MSETQLVIPKRYKRALASFVELSDETLARLAEQLVAAAPTATMHDLAQRLSGTLPLQPDQLAEMLRMFASLQGLQGYSGIPADQIGQEVLTAVESDANIRYPQEKHAQLALRLSQIVGESRALRVASRAGELRDENQRRLCSGNCRVITDIRPIFSSDAGEKPDAAMIMHTLKIAFHEHSGEDVLEFYVTMDGDDIRALSDHLQRAISKESTLAKWIGETATSFFAEE